MRCFKMCNRYYVLLVFCAVAIISSAQELQITYEVNSSKPTSLVDDQLNALQNTGGIKYSVTLPTKVTSIERAVYTLGGIENDLQYTLNQETHEVAFTTQPEFSFDEEGDFNPFSVSISYIKYANDSNDSEIIVEEKTVGFAVKIWPEINISPINPVPSYLLSGEGLSLSVATEGGYADGWEYVWSTGGYESTILYNATNVMNEPKVENVTVTVINKAPGGEIWAEENIEYDITVYSLPTLNGVNPSNVVFSGTDISLSVETFGGNPNGWEYLWDNGERQNSINRKVNNTGPDVKEDVCSVSVINKSPDGEIDWLSTSIPFSVLVWPEAEAQLKSDKSYTAFINGAEVKLTVESVGGDPDRWRYSWSIDGTALSNTGSILNYTLTNTTGEMEEHEITVEVTNSPEGIDAPYVKILTYRYIVYPTPSISSATQDKEVVFSGTSVRMGVEVSGGNPSGWTYSWACDGMPVEGTDSWISVVQNNEGTHVYEVTAVNTLEGVVNELTKSFQVVVWPKASAQFNSEIANDVNVNTVVPVQIATIGGDPSAWIFIYRLNGKIVYQGPDYVYDIPMENQAEEMTIATITVTATNSPVGIDEPTTINLSHSLNVWALPSSQSINNSHIVLCSGYQKMIGVNTFGGGDGTWEIEWSKNGTPIDNQDFTISLDLVNTEPFKRTEVYQVICKNVLDGEVRYENRYEYTVDVYAQPEVTQGQAIWNVYYGNSVTLSVDEKLGYPGGWSFLWTENLPNSSSVEYSAQNSQDDSYVKHITLVVTNEYDNEVWLTKSFTYTVNCWSKGTISAKPVKANYNGSVNMTLETNQQGGYVDGWSYSWQLNGISVDEDNSEHYVNEINRGELKNDYSWVLIATNSLNGEIGCREELQYNYTVWPEIVAPDGFIVSKDAVRNGESVTLYVSEPATGGYEYLWNYDWQVDGIVTHTQSSSIEKTIEISSANNGKASRQVSCGLRLYNQAPDEMFFDESFSKSITVYASPSTPLQLTKKGNGTTCTMVVLTDYTDEQLANLEYYFVFGYTDRSGVDHEQPFTSDRYMRFSQSEYNNSSNDFWVYALWRYGDGVIVTSDRRHLNGSVTDFNGSDFDDSGRGLAAVGTVNEDQINIYVAADRFLVTLPEASQCHITLLDLNGIALFDRMYESQNSVEDSFGNVRLGRGYYIFRVTTEDSTKSIKILI